MLKSQPKWRPCPETVRAELSTGYLPGDSPADHLEPVSKLTLLSEEKRSSVLAAVREMCRIFWGPDIDHCREMVRNLFLEPLGMLAAGCPNTPALETGEIRRIISGSEDYRALFGYLEEGYLRLFVNTREGICAPLYHSCYEHQNAPLMGAAARAMNRRLQSKGLDVAADLHEPPDHLAVELEYLYFLLNTGWQEQNDALLQEARQFCGSELLPWLLQLESRLAGETDCRFYPLMVSALVWLVGLLAEDGNCREYTAA